MVERVSVAKGVSISHKKSGGEVSGDEIRGKQQAGRLIVVLGKKNEGIGFHVRSSAIHTRPFVQSHLSPAIPSLFAITSCRMSFFSRKKHTQPSNVALVHHPPNNQPPILRRDNPTSDTCVSTLFLYSKLTCFFSLATLYLNPGGPGAERYRVPGLRS